MTSKLEQNFYDTFGIEPLSKWHKCKDYSCICCDEYEFCSRREFIYPDITAEKLLEMICVLNEHYCNNYQCATMIVGDTIEKIKECILKDCIKQSQHIKSKIQQLFKD